eukprot:6212488-Pleurochrysis_carterae.AAC.3
MKPSQPYLGLPTAPRRGLKPPFAPGARARDTRVAPAVARSSLSATQRPSPLLPTRASLRHFRSAIPLSDAPTHTLVSPSAHSAAWRASRASMSAQLAAATAC